MLSKLKKTLCRLQTLGDARVCTQHYTIWWSDDEWSI